MGRRTPVVAAATLVLSLLLLGWVAFTWWSPPPSAGPPPPSGAASAPAPAASPPVTAAPAPVPTPRDVLRVEVPSAGYASEVGTMAIAGAGVIDPPDFRRVWWISDRGAAPGSGATDTTYFACHTDAAKATSAVPCNVLDAGSVPVGSSVRVTTDAEVLTYTVRQARKVPRDEFAGDAQVWDVNPGRLVLVTCSISGGRRTDFNFVVIAELAR